MYRIRIADAGSITMHNVLDLMLTHTVKNPSRSS